VEEWVGRVGGSGGVRPREFDRLARGGARGRFAICAIVSAGADARPVRDEFKSLGYQLITTEPLMVHRLARVPRPAAPAGVTILPVTTAELADRLATEARRRQILPEHLTAGAASPLRQYAAVEDRSGTPIAWARSVAVAEKRATWVSNVHTQPAYRRRGIARSLLARMLRDDRRSGARASVLLASHVGARLYEAVGYQQIGTLLLFMPKRS
jgi:GNAT superfamily N-acetyltransferase